MLGGRTRLSSIDIYESRVTINTCYLFQYHLDPAELVESLRVMMRSYPQIGATIKSYVYLSSCACGLALLSNFSSENNEVYLEHARPNLAVHIAELDFVPDFSLAGNATLVACEKFPWPETIPLGSKTMIVPLHFVSLSLEFKGLWIAFFRRITLVSGDSDETTIDAVCVRYLA